jgi:hypothetical protein
MQSYHFTSTHSWLGIAAAALYLFTFLFGSLMASLTRFYPDSILRQAFDLKSAHRNLGVCVLTLTTIAVLTGIMDYLPVGSCNPQSSGYEGDSALYYSNTPMSCRLVNGLSIVVMIAAGLGGLAIAYRGDSFGLSLNNADRSTVGPIPPPTNPNATSTAVSRASPRSRQQVSYASVPNREVEVVQTKAALGSSPHEHIPIVAVAPTPRHL